MNYPILDFYRLETGNPEGFRLNEIWSWTNSQLEGGHTYIQWMFPSNEPSKMVSGSPVLTLEEADEFGSDPLIRSYLYRSFERILDFYGFQLIEEENPVIRLMEGTDYRPDPQIALRGFNHNMLRVTRILKSLRLGGMEVYAHAWYESLQPWKTKVNETTWDFWTQATYGPLWDSSGTK